MAAKAAGYVAGAIRLEAPASRGEAVLLTIHGMSIIEGLHTVKHNEAVQFYAF
jgi:hypothetical protein